MSCSPTNQHQNASTSIVVMNTRLDFQGVGAQLDSFLVVSVNDHERECSPIKALSCRETKIKKTLITAEAKHPTRLSKFTSEFFTGLPYFYPRAFITYVNNISSGNLVG